MLTIVMQPLITTVKFLNFGMPEIFAVIQTKRPNLKGYFVKMVQMEWQTVKTQIWVCTVCPDLTDRKLRVITVLPVSKKENKTVPREIIAVFCFNFRNDQLHNI